MRRSRNVDPRAVGAAGLQTFDAILRAYLHPASHPLSGTPASVDGRHSRRQALDRESRRPLHAGPCARGFRVDDPAGAGIEPFAPFYFGDYLWSTMTRFVEFHGLEGLRRPQGLS
jgi:hypothetical protein